MEYISLQNIRDIYPSGEENVNDTFSIPDPPSIPINQAYIRRSETSIEFRGKYPENTILFDIPSFNSVKVIQTKVDGISDYDFPFIVNFAAQDGTPDYWTSPEFKRRIDNAINENNPYFSLDKIPVVVVPFDILSRYATNTRFDCEEDYAEVDVIETLDTKEEMLKHIQWMISGVEELRPVRDIGNWQLNITAALGMGYADCVKRNQVGNELDGFNENAFPIENLPEISDFVFDNSLFRNPLNDPRSNQDFEGGIDGREDNTDPREDGVIVENREDNRSNTDFDGSPRGDSNVTVLDTETRDESRSTEDYTIGTSPRGIDNTDVRTYDYQPIEVRSSTTGTGTYYPFTTAGTHIGENRTYNRQTYIWTGTSWMNINTM